MRERWVELDLAKGIGIILVVWAHAHGPFSNYINGFHMPFFFFISGMLYVNKGRTVKEYILRKGASLLLPFWWWNLVMYPVFFLLYYNNNWDVNTAVSDIVKIVLTVYKVPFLGATWFLASLFWISVIVHVLATALKKCKYRDQSVMIISMIFTIIGFQITFPYRISRTLICLMFYSSGYIYQNHIKSYIKHVAKIPISVASIIIYILITNAFKSDLAENTYDNKALFVVGAYLATYFMLYVSGAACMAVQKSALVEHLIYLGKNSIDIVIWHFLAFRIAIVIQIIAIGGSFSAITSFPVYDARGGWWILYLLAGIYGSLLWMMVLKHNSLSDKMRKIHMIR